VYDALGGAHRLDLQALAWQSSRHEYRPALVISESIATVDKLLRRKLKWCLHRFEIQR